MNSQAENLSLRHASIGELVAEDWRRAEVFKKHGIDFCCGGKQTVEAACEQKNIDLHQLETELHEVENEIKFGSQDFNKWELNFLIDYIINVHHQYVGEAIPFLAELTHKVAYTHGDNHPELIEIEKLFQDVSQELALHMQKEEMILFPYIKEMTEARKNGTLPPYPAFGTIANPIHMMEAEHTSAGSAMETIEELSKGFTPPVDACPSYQIMFAKLQEFQQNLHQHVHLENNILFPKAIQLEKSFRAS